MSTTTWIFDEAWGSGYGKFATEAEAVAMVRAMPGGEEADAEQLRHPIVGYNDASGELLAYVYPFTPRPCQFYSHCGNLTDDPRQPHAVNCTSCAAMLAGPVLAAHARGENPWDC